MAEENVDPLCGGAEEAEGAKDDPVGKTCPLLKGDRYQGSGRMDEYPKLTESKPFTYAKGKMIDQGITTPTQTDEKEEQGQGQPEGQQGQAEEAAEGDDAGRSEVGPV